MALNNLLGSIETIDINAGYEEQGNNLPDGNYTGYVTGFDYYDKAENGGLFVIKINTDSGDKYTNFININEKTVKFNMRKLLLGLYYITPYTEDINQLQVEVLNDPEGFTAKFQERILGKTVYFTLKTKKNFQNCYINKETTESVKNDEFPF